MVQLVSEERKVRDDDIVLYEVLVSDGALVLPPRLLLGAAHIRRVSNYGQYALVELTAYYLRRSAADQEAAHYVYTSEAKLVHQLGGQLGSPVRALPKDRPRKAKPAAAAKLPAAPSSKVQKVEQA